jgi:hypothetical protein
VKLKWIPTEQGSRKGGKKKGSRAREILRKERSYRSKQTRTCWKNWSRSSIHDLWSRKLERLLDYRIFPKLFENR